MSVGPRKSTRRPGFWSRILTVLTIVGLALAAAGWWKSTHWAPSRDTYPVQGLSLSSDQENVNWNAVRAAGADFAYIRATSGIDHRDPSFARNWAEARRAGLRYGAELVYDPCRLAVDQATLFITTVPRDNAALPPAIRLDTNPRCQPGRDRILSELNTLINLVESHSGKPSVLHLSESFDHAFDISHEINRTLWLDRNFLLPDYAGGRWVMWTASTMRRIDQVPGGVEWVVVAP